ncbi:MAG: hypothetical protein IMZ54_05275 [Acidobacteria bacterium]|nr:hypothetical protein [Acidobacteriota bacterium]MBE3130118.1 hypothetical protein [Acidobacteriota bacterium]
MTRKTIAFMIAAGMLLGLAAARPAGAQSRENERPLGFYINLGYVNLNGYPKWIALGPELELRLGKIVSFNPELSVWLRDSFGNSAHVVPGVTVNFRLRRFFFGGGVVRRISDWAEDAGGWLVPKFQLGYLSGPTRLSLSLHYLNRTDDIVLGLNFGFRIGIRRRD